jgi:hypothetical protein
VRGVERKHRLPDRDFNQMFGPGTISAATGDEHPLAKVGVQLIH